jgi:hypothetical protein
VRKRGEFGVGEVGSSGGFHSAHAANPVCSYLSICFATVESRSHSSRSFGRPDRQGGIAAHLSTIGKIVSS